LALQTYFQVVRPDIGIVADARRCDADKAFGEIARAVLSDGIRFGDDIGNVLRSPFNRRSDFSPSGLPIGVQIIGPYLEDATTIAFADLLEREFSGFRPPPLSR